MTEKNPMESGEVCSVCQRLATWVTYSDRRFEQVTEARCEEHLSNQQKRDRETGNYWPEINDREERRAGQEQQL